MAEWMGGAWLVYVSAYIAGTVLAFPLEISLLSSFLMLKVYSAQELAFGALSVL